MTTISYGADVPDEAELRLCGDVAGKRVVELGVGDPPNALVFASLGAKAIAVDPSAERIATARKQTERGDARVELHEADLADLGFATSASVDLVFSMFALAAVDDLPRLFRQVHRVLRPGAPLVFSVPHPIAAMLEGGEVVLRRPYWGTNARTVSALFTSLSRANFQVDVVLEPAPVSHPSSLVPAALIMRARKLGV